MDKDLGLSEVQEDKTPLGETLLVAKEVKAKMSCITIIMKLIYVALSILKKIIFLNKQMNQS